MNARTLSGRALADALQDSRARTLALVADLDDAQWLMPMQPGVNPIAWELGHLAWFGEFWVLRGPHHRGADGLVHAARPAAHAGPDAIFDSARLAHDARWQVALPSRSRVRTMLDAQLDACLGAMPEADDDAALYAHRLSLFHEDMHAEALVWCRAALGWPAPAEALLPRCTPRPPLRVREAAVQVGWPPGRRGFAFDNEMPGQAMYLEAFEIDAQPVTAGQYQRFVDAGGPVPRRWRRHDGRWQARWFDEWRDLVPEEPVIHVNAHDAQAYAEWAGRRLVRAAEWEHAAATHGSDFAWGHGVWEWTADDFMPHAGFEPGPYADYSAPWFGSHRELRGGSFATHERLHDVRYRNFFEPHRDDVFAGFRTAARAA